MCGCQKHHDESKACTCICLEHRNFEAAYHLAMRRYDEIVGLQRWKDEALEVISGLQELGRALDLRLGTSITGPRAVEAVNALKAERDDLADRLSALLCDLTGGLMSKTSYPVPVMVQAIEAEFEKRAAGDDDQGSTLPSGGRLLAGGGADYSHIPLKED